MPWLRTPLPWCALALGLLAQPAVLPPAAELAATSGRQVLQLTAHSDGRGAVLTPRRDREPAAETRLEVDRGERTAARRVRVRPMISARPYANIIEKASERHGVELRLVHALIETESGYRADATSLKGAVGLMQLMPATVERYAVGDPFDPEANVNAGTRYLRSLLDKFGLRGALAAYNAGEGAVRRFDGMHRTPRPVGT